MNKLNFEEIKSILMSKIESVAYFAHDDFNDQELGLGTIKEVHSEGGVDRGSHWVSVKHFVDHDIYISVTGFYQSHYGTDFDDGWDSLSQVFPTQRVITVYE